MKLCKECGAECVGNSIRCEKCKRELLVAKWRRKHRLDRADNVDSIAQMKRRIRENEERTWQTAAQRNAQ